MTTETIKKIQDAEISAEELEKSAIKSSELIAEKARNEAAEIIEKAKSAGKAFLDNKSAEAQKFAEEQSAENQKKIDGEIKAMEDAVSSKLGEAVEKIKEMLIKPWEDDHHKV